MTALYRAIYFFVVRILLPLLHSVNDKVARGYKLRQPQNGILPWLAPLFAALIAITFIPEITLWLPRYMGMVR